MGSRKLILALRISDNFFWDIWLHLLHIKSTRNKKLLTILQYKLNAGKEYLNKFFKIGTNKQKRMEIFTNLNIHITLLCKHIKSKTNKFIKLEQQIIYTKYSFKQFNNFNFLFFDELTECLCIQNLFFIDKNYFDERNITLNKQ